MFCSYGTFLDHMQPINHPLSPAAYKLQKKDFIAQVFFLFILFKLEILWEGMGADTCNVSFVHNAKH